MKFKQLYGFYGYQNIARRINFLNFRSNRANMFCKIGALKSSIKFEKKNVWRNLFLTKLQSIRLQVYCKATATQVLTYKIFQNKLPIKFFRINFPQNTHLPLVLYFHALCSDYKTRRCFLCISHEYFSLSLVACDCI